METGELQDIIISVLAIAVAFSIADMSLFPIVLLTVGLGFVLHELGHRFVARHYGAHAFYKAWPEGLLFMFATAIISRGSFLFAAPGAVYIYSPYLSRRENGIISISGAVVNFVLAMLFLFIGLAIGMIGTTRAVELGAMFLYIGTLTNLYLALFNMIPFPPLDGSKVAAWNPLVWFLFTGIVFAAWAFFRFLIPMLLVG